MNTAQKTYGTPITGCYFDHANYNNDELSVAIIEFTMDFGWTIDAHDSALMNTDSDELSAEGSQELQELSDDAINWLNGQEMRTGLYWANKGEANAFGLWVNLEVVKEEVEFISSETQHTPIDGYRGEWLEVNDHGNCTLYFRDGKGRDKEIWSIV